MDSIVRGTIQLRGVPEAVAGLRAYKAALIDVSGASPKTTLTVDSSALSRAKSDVASLGSAHQALSTKSASLGVDYSQIASARTAVQGLDGDIGKMATSLSKVAAPAALAGIGLGVTRLASDFATMTTNIRNNTTETDADFAAMNKTIKALSTEGGASLDSLAGGFMHAFNLTNSAAQATTDLSIAMKSAVSTGSDVNSTTDALAKTMHQFGIEGSGAAATMDTLHTASALGNTTLEQFIGSSAKAMVTAASLGVSLQDVSAAYVGLTKSGFDAGEANTQLAALMTHIINPTKQAKAELASLSATTGVDLVRDFSLAGIQSKGLTGVLSDLRTATGGQEDAILKLIPAQRGGIGALALTTSAYRDVIDAGTQLALVQSGQMTPTADAFARTQETLGFKVSVLGQQLKQLGIDAGGATIGPISALVGAIGSIPQGVDKAVIGFGLAGLAIKTVSVASDLLVTGTARVGAAMAAETATVTADTAAWTANTAARNAASGISGVGGYAARSAAAQTGVDAVGLAGYEARTAAQAEAGLASKLSGGIAGLGAGIGTAALPVAIPLAVTFSVGKFIVEPWQNAVRDEATKLEQTKVEMTIQTTVRYAQSADSRTQGRADLQAQLAEAQSIQKEFEGLAASGVGGDQAQKAVEFFKVQQAEISKALTDTSPEHYASQAADEFSKHLADLSSAVENNRLTLDQATKFADAYRQEAIDTGAGVDQAAAAEKGWAAAIKDRQNAAYQARYVELKTMQDERDRAKDLLDKGAPPALVETAVFGKGAGIDPAVLVQQEAELKKWEVAYADTQAANKKAATDSAATQKAEIQAVATAQEQALTKSADAWRAASSAIGQIDLTKGLQSLIDAAPGLDKVQLDLAMLGRNDSALDNLARVADRFKSISDAEKQASAAYNGYLLTLDQTDARVSKIDALKTRLLAAVDAAQQAKLRGTANANDEAVIAGAPGAFAQLNQAEVTLKGNGAQDWAGIIQNLPEWLRGQLQADSSTHSAVGDGKQLLLSVEADKTKATADLDAFEKQDRKAVVKITADTTLAKDSIDAFIKNIPTSIPLLITTPPGGLDPSRGIDGGGSAPPASVGGNTMTPRGDAANLLPYADLIQKAASDKQIPAWLLGAIIEHESGGNVGAVQPGGLGRGLTQVDIGQNPSYDEKRLTGTSREDAAYQINSGAEILKRFFDQYGGDAQKAIQNYAGPAYQSQAGGGVPAGLDFATELTNYYKNQVQAALAGGNLGGKGSGGLLPGYGPGDVGLGSAQNPTGGALNVVNTGGASSSAILADAQKHIGDKFNRFGQDVWFKCEQIVDDILQEAGVTDFRAVDNADAATADTHIKAAMAGKPGAGRVVSAADARAGDLVGWLGNSPYAGTPGGEGHIGVVSSIDPSGKGNYIGTTRQGVQERPIGPDAVFIRPDGVVAGGPEPGATIYKGAPSARAAMGYGPGTYTSTGGTAQASTQSLEQLARAVAHVDEKGALLKQTLSTLAPKDFSATIGQFNTLSPILDKQAHANDNEFTTPTTKIQESQDALAKNLVATNLWGEGLAAITTKSGHLADVQKEISSTIGGPVAAALNRELDSYNTIAQTADRINTLTERRKAIEAASAQTATARQAADTLDSRNQTRQSWADQNVDTALANRGRVENVRFTGVTRTEEDKSRELAFQQQLQATELQNKLVDLQKTQQSTIWQRTSAEQSLERNAAGAGTNTQQGVLSARLAAMHEQDLAQKDLNTKAIDDIQLQIRAEAKKANLDSYNLETERIAEQRKHENILQGISDEGVANTATRQARDRAHQIDLWNIQDTRLREDQRDAARLAAIDKEIVAQQAMATQADANLKATQDALAIYQQTGIDLGTFGSTLDAVVQKAIKDMNTAGYYASVAGLKTSSGVPYSQFPAPGASHYASGTGGYVSGLGIVGDTASGDVSRAEAVEGTYRVYPHDSPVTQRALMGTRHYAGGTVAPIRQGNAGGNGSLTFNFGPLIAGSDGISPEQLEGRINEITRQFNQALREAVRQMKQSGRKHLAANGMR